MSVLTLRRNGSYLENWDETVNGFDSTDISVTYTDLVDLERGMNELVYTLTDFAGNVTEYTVFVEYIEKDHLQNLIDLGQTVAGPTLDLQRALEAGVALNVGNDTTQAEVDAAVAALEAALLQNNPMILNPVIEGVRNMQVEVGETVDLFAGVTAQDAFGKDLTRRIHVAPGTLDTDVAGTYQVTYTVLDDYGRSAAVTVFVEVVDPIPPMNEVFEPVAGEIVVDLNIDGALPVAERGIANTAELPEGTTYTYENAEAVDLSGEVTTEQSVTVVVTYNDGTQDRIHVPVSVIAKAVEEEEKPESGKRPHPVFDTHPSENRGKGNSKGKGKPGAKVHPVFPAHPSHTKGANVPAVARHARGF